MVTIAMLNLTFYRNIEIPPPPNTNLVYWKVEGGVWSIAEARTEEVPSSDFFWMKEDSLIKGIMESTEVTTVKVSDRLWAEVSGLEARGKDGSFYHDSGYAFFGTSRQKMSIEEFKIRFGKDGRVLYKEELDEMENFLGAVMEAKRCWFNAYLTAGFLHYALSMDRKEGASVLLGDYSNIDKVISEISNQLLSNAAG